MDLLSNSTCVTCKWCSSQPGPTQAAWHERYCGPDLRAAHPRLLGLRRQEGLFMADCGDLAVKPGLGLPTLSLFATRHDSPVQISTWI